MRIGIVTGEYPPMQGGVGAYSQILAHQLVTSGHQVYAFTSAHDALVTGGVEVTRWDRGWGWQAWRGIQDWVVAYQLEVVNLQFQTAAFGMSPWVHFLPKRVSVPLVTTFHDLRHPYLFPKAGALRDWIVMYLARRSAGVIVTNHEDYERVRRRTRSAMIPIGSNILTEAPEDYDRKAWRRRVGIGADDFVLAHFGFINHSKGVETLLEGVARLRDERGIMACALMIGGRTGSSDATNADYANVIDARIAELGISDAVHWTGYVTDTEVSEFLRASDVIVLPYRDGASFRRGSLMAGIEHGCAIVSTLPQVNIPEFKQGENMMLIGRDDVAGLVDVIGELHENPDKLAQLRAGASGLKRHFDWGYITDKTVDFFGLVLDGDG